MQPMIQIRQSPALIGIEAGLGEYSIRQPRADLTIATERSGLDIQHENPRVTIDQSKAWAAYTGGSVIEMNNRIYSGMRDIFLRGIANRVEQGNRVASIHKPGSTIADVYGTDTEAGTLPEFRGPASFDNVDIDVQVSPLQVSYREGKTDIQARVNPPEISYQRGKLNIYMRQYPSIEIIPPALDAMI